MQFGIVMLVCLLPAVLAIPTPFFESKSLPLPFRRVLSLQSPELTGNDVLIAQTFLSRSKFVEDLQISGAFDAATEKAVKEFQKGCGIGVDGIIGADTASQLLARESNDRFVDDGKSAASRGYLYKIHVPVHANRSIETRATLYSANNTVLHTFVARCHGYDSTGGKPWPDYTNSDAGLNQFTTDGNTPTGLGEIDLNTPEDDEKSFGPFDVNRVVRGLEGNMKLLLPNIRDGILLHTGEWPGWVTSSTMPNSAGCIHAHPEDIKLIAQILQAHGVVAHKNPANNGASYPYKPQGLIAVELVDAI